MQRVGHYKKCIYAARACERSDGLGWRCEVYIAQDLGFSTLDTPFCVDQTFDTGEQAIAAAIEFAKQKIDVGIVPTSVIE